jgi:hypothetical protein
MAGRSSGAREAPPERAQVLDFFALLERLPPSARMLLLVEEKERLERHIQRIDELLKELKQ